MSFIYLFIYFAINASIIPRLFEFMDRATISNLTSFDQVYQLTAEFYTISYIIKYIPLKNTQLQIKRGRGVNKGMQTTDRLLSIRLKKVLNPNPFAT